jgi:putative drug exporter of the RND superfamily
MIFKQFGVGLAAAILIDATVIRAVLLPASMSLLGRWNWYLPGWLEWLPRLEHGHYEPDEADRLGETGATNLPEPELDPVR